MGVARLWDDFDGLPETTLLEWVKAFHCENWRAPRIALDVPLFQQEILQITSPWGYANFHRQFIRRLAALSGLGIDVYCVFDGASGPKKLRNARRRTSWDPPAVRWAKKCVRAFGFAVIEAPGEAEAQCVHMQQQCLVDFVFSGDSDVLCLGATAMVYYLPQKGQATTPIRRKVRVVVLQPGKKSSPDHGHWNFVLRALLQGNDFDAGVHGIGYEFAKEVAAAHTGFAEELRAIYTATSEWERSELVAAFHERLMHELKTNESKFFGSKKRNAKLLPTFPDQKIMQMFAEPTVKTPSNSEMRLGRLDHLALHALWRGKSPIFNAEAAKHTLKGGDRDGDKTADADCAAAIASARVVDCVRNGGNFLAFIKTKERGDVITRVTFDGSADAMLADVAEKAEVPTFLVDRKLFGNGRDRTVASMFAARHATAPVPPKPAPILSPPDLPESAGLAVATASEPTAVICTPDRIHRPSVLGLKRPLAPIIFNDDVGGYPTTPRHFKMEFIDDSDEDEPLNGPSMPRVLSAPRRLSPPRVLTPPEKIATSDDLNSELAAPVAAARHTALPAARKESSLCAYFQRTRPAEHMQSIEEAQRKRQRALSERLNEAPAIAVSAKTVPGPGLSRKPRTISTISLPISAKGEGPVSVAKISARELKARQVAEHRERSVSRWWRAEPSTGAATATVSRERPSSPSS